MDMLQDDPEPACDILHVLRLKEGSCATVKHRASQHTVIWRAGPQQSVIADKQRTDCSTRAAKTEDPRNILHNWCDLSVLDTCRLSRLHHQANSADMCPACCEQSILPCVQHMHVTKQCCTNICDTRLKTHTVSSAQLNPRHKQGNHSGSGIQSPVS